MTDDAKLCAQTIIDLRSELLRLIKYEGMANDEATNKMYQKTTDALFAASRIIAPRAAAEKDAALTRGDREEALQRDYSEGGINERIAFRRGWNAAILAANKGQK
jgi:hypothetical protein